MLPHWTILLLPFAPIALARHPIVGRGHLLPAIGGYERDTLGRRQDPSISAPVIDLDAVPSSTPANSAFVPDPSALAAASKNTTALQYAQYLDSTSTDNCTEAGGGCAQFQLTLGECVADDCICQDDHTLAAMICAQCLATKEAIMVYNTYLNWCDMEGMANPTDTFGVSMGPSGSISQVAGLTVTSTSTIMTTVQVSASTSAAGAQSSGEAPSASGSLVGGVAAIAGIHIQSSPPISSISLSGLVGGSSVPSSILVPGSELVPSASISGGPLVFAALQDSASASLPSTGSSLASSLAQSSGSGSSATVVSSVGSSLGSSSTGSSIGIASHSPTSAGGPPMTQLTGINVLAIPSSTSGSAVSGLGGSASSTASGAASGLPSPMGPLSLLSNDSTSTAALNAAIAFFSGVTVTSCEDKCTVWKGLSNTCTQDQCICTPAGTSSAASCSSCIGSGSNGATPPDLQANYAAFIGNCSSMGIVAPSGGVVPSGVEIVAAASSAPLPSGGLGSVASVSPSMSLPPVVDAAEQQGVVTVTRNHADGRVAQPLLVHGWAIAVGMVGVVAGGVMII